MPVPQINIINYCKEWIGICSNFGDVEDQKKIWFRCEGSEIGSFDDDVTHMNFVLHAWSETERNEYLNKECNDLIQKFIDELSKFREDPQTDFILADEEELLSDPRWLKIVNLAQEAKAALEKYLKEVKNDERR